jgi:cytochrome P450
MPSYVIAELMGIPLDDGRKLYQLTETIHSAPEAVPEGAQGAAVMEMFMYAQRVIAEKRARPADDLSSKLLAAEVDGRKLDDLDFQLFFLLLVDAGGDTTRNLVAAGLLALLEHPNEFARLRANTDALLPSARDELLRWVSPVIYMRRTDKVVRYFGAANFDERQFAAPYHLDLTRSPNMHIAFGAGAHVCLGQHIARVEIDALLREVVARMHDIELAQPPEWLASNFISGPKRMPVRFRPGARSR